MTMGRAVEITGRNPRTFDCTGLDHDTLHAAWTMVAGLTHIGPKADTIAALVKNGYIDKPLKGKPKWLT
jgi:hypothetical protein